MAQGTCEGQRTNSHVGSCHLPCLLQGLLEMGPLEEQPSDFNHQAMSTAPQVGALTAV